MTIQTEYVIDRKGEKKSVVLSIKDYLKLIEYLEDLEDAVDLKKAKQYAKDFVDFEDIANKLKAKRQMH